MVSRFANYMAKDKNISENIQNNKSKLCQLCKKKYNSLFDREHHCKRCYRSICAS